MQKTSLVIGLCSIGLILSGCQSFQSSPGNQKARCEEMKHQMMFSGETANRSLAFQEQSEQDRLSQSYHDEGCT